MDNKNAGSQQEEGFAEDYFSQQPYEVFQIVMDPLKRELDEYLEKDEEYQWVFISEHVKVQTRSKSLDMCKEYELGEDEIAGRKYSVA
mmetsp:Transcript_11481/g.19431  ORF Transcript_11481/g.19431 Transcript_11481/m.19431 type:complete len:88 (-) Transcript_11481:86-349(-)